MHTHAECSEGRDREIAQIACMIKLPQAPETLPVRSASLQKVNISSMSKVNYRGSALQ